MECPEARNCCMCGCPFIPFHGESACPKCKEQETIKCDNENFQR
jgi:hypothetical protein